jgi:hypothetical protein
MQVLLYSIAYLRLRERLLLQYAVDCQFDISNLSMAAAEKSLLKSGLHFGRRRG